eukprot:347016-Chlamydomonas_euryale.AAC.4
MIVKRSKPSKITYKRSASEEMGKTKERLGFLCCVCLDPSREGKPRDSVWRASLSSGGQGHWAGPLMPGWKWGSGWLVSCRCWLSVSQAPRVCVLIACLASRRLFGRLLLHAQSTPTRLSRLVPYEVSQHRAMRSHRQIPNRPTRRCCRHCSVSPRSAKNARSDACHQPTDRDMRMRWAQGRTSGRDSAPLSADACPGACAAPAHPVGSCTPRAMTGQFGSADPLLAVPPPPRPCPLQSPRPCSCIRRGRVHSGCALCWLLDAATARTSP